MAAPKWLSRLYQSNSRFHLLVAPVRHKLVALLNRSRDGHLQQAWGTTALNRRPALFAALREIFPDTEGARVLSYGCSTGEEVIDLLQHYRAATLYGTDVHRGRLKQAEQRIGNPNVVLFHSSEENLRKQGPFDLIVACSVFIRHPEDSHTNDLSHIYPFTTFETGLQLLFENLKVGGLMLIHNANYRVMATRFAPQLTPVRHANIAQSRNVPLFDPNGHKLPDAPYDEQLFRRVG